MSERQDKPAAPPATPSPDDPPGLAPGERLPRPVFVRLAVLVALATTLLAAAAIGWRWFNTSFPNAVIVAEGADEWATGVEVTVRDAAGGREVARGTLSTANSREYVVLVEQGGYVVRARLGDTVLYDRRVHVLNGQGVRIRVDVPPALRRPPAGGAATRATAGADRTDPGTALSPVR